MSPVVRENPSLYRQRYTVIGERQERLRINLRTWQIDPAASTITNGEFASRQIPRECRRPDYSILSLPLDMLPDGTTRVQLRAYDDTVSLPAR